MEMKMNWNRNSTVFAAILLGALLGFAPPIFAQYGGGGMRQQPMPQQQQQQPYPQQQQQPVQGSQPPAAETPKVDPEEEAAYKAFYDLKSDSLDQVIKSGEQFVQKYPTSLHTEGVYAKLAQAYFNAQNYDKMQAAADKALNLNPDDVNVLVLIGWFIPHNYNPEDLGAENRLDKAEKYETHALAVLASLSKPAGITDEQFETTKTALTSQAHSGLGLIYFRRQQYDNSVKELQQATQIGTSPDPVDYYVMGVELKQLNRLADAADAFQKCGNIAGGLQGRCKQMADESKKNAATQPATAKP
jgi:tetratricopeptide (TPR) repeat protein